MNLSVTVSEDVLVVIDDYETGEVLYEDTLWTLHRFNRHFDVLGFERNVEWALKDGKPVAFVTVDFRDKLGEFKDYIAAVESDEEVSEEEWDKLESFETWLSWK